MLVIKEIGLPFAVVRLCLSRVWLQTELDSTQSYYHYFKIVVWRISYHDLARCHRQITEPGDGRLLGRYRQRGLWWITVVWSGLACSRHSDIHVLGIYSGEWLELKNTEEKNWEGISPYPSSPLPTPAAIAFFSCSLFFAPVISFFTFCYLSWGTLWLLRIYFVLVLAYSKFPQNYQSLWTVDNNCFFNHNFN